MKLRIQCCLFCILLLFLSCSQVRYYTYHEGGHDPLFDISSAKTIGFIPFCWTDWAKESGCNEIFEKQLYTYAKRELEKRGFDVYYITPENLIQDTPPSKAVFVRDEYQNIPDLTLTAGFYQGLGNKVRIPGQAFGTLGWGNYGGSGYYSETQSQEVQTYFLSLAYTLWSGGPKYMNKVWEGVIKKGSPKLDLQEKAQKMTTEIFKKKFD